MPSDRREFFQTLGLGAVGLAAGAAALSSSSCNRQTAGEDGPVLQIGENIARVDTTNGPVKGYILRGIHYYLGIPYGADTSGPNRFMPPQKPKPWKDVYPAVWWGNSAPQNMANRYANKYGAFRDHWNYDDVSEDCLRINVFTPGVNDGQKRPVLFWIHGGGFTSGNSIEHDGYNGENLARLGNVVFVSINHRLGPMGFCNLSGVGGEKYAASGNVGMMDIVAALEWVRDNIANFGGDPGNVTIMGQSGGGRKVCALNCMPSAKGLFHKAVSLSGVQTEWASKEYSQQLGEFVLREAKLGRGQVDRLQTMPWEEYYAIAMRAQQTMTKETGLAAPGGVGGFVPWLDGNIIAYHTARPDAPPIASDVPMIICSTFDENSPSAFNPELEKITLEQLVERLRKPSGSGMGATPGLGDKAAAVVEAYGKVFPGLQPIDILCLIGSQPRRQAAITLADAKAKQPAGAYLAWFGWRPPLFDNRLRAFHCIDICFWFYNTDLMLTHTGGGARPRKLATTMAGQLLQFMKTGDPNGSGLPKWPKYTTANGETMLLNDTCEVKNDPDREARRALVAAS
jgi:para-nitrobenzyl esterase